MSILDKTLNLGAHGTVELIKSLPTQPVPTHSHKGLSIDVSV